MAAIRTETTHGHTSSMAAARGVTTRLKDADRVGRQPGKDNIVRGAGALESSCLYSLTVQLYRLSNIRLILEPAAHACW